VHDGRASHRVAAAQLRNDAGLALHFHCQRHEIDDMILMQSGGVAAAVEIDVE
jgi:hypothetical protein